MQLPDTLAKGYTALPEVAALAVKARVNVIGFVIDSMEPKLTGKGGQFNPIELLSVH